MRLRFSKMHGLGNDFAVVDCRDRPLALDAAAIRRLADRHRGIGFDQLLTIEPARDASCAFAYGIWNADGEPVGQCGNGVRCVARWLAREGLLRTGAARLQSPSGPVGVELLDDGRVRVDMGEPRFGADDIPLALDAASLRTLVEPDVMLAIDEAELTVGVVSIGNPHAVLEVDDLAAAPVATLGRRLERDALFARGANVGFVHRRARDAIDLRVWERGVGETQACGTGACAAVAVLRRRGAVEADVRVRLPGGELDIHWNGEGEPLHMTGPAAFVFEGEWFDEGGRQ